MIVTWVGWPVVGNEMVSIPPGRVVLSGQRTQCTWPVNVELFHMSAFPVTQEWYARITGQRPSAAQGGRLPVEGVSWWDAVRFCNAVSEHEGLRPAYRLVGDCEVAEWDASADGYRLPTEGEWEHACRAGTLGTVSSMRSLGIGATRTAESMLWAVNGPTSGACTTCWVTCGVGAGISTTPR
jgi:formylglycine-generating enzyme required for sulfatase activity